MDVPRLSNVVDELDKNLNVGGASYEKMLVL